MYLQNVIVLTLVVILTFRMTATIIAVRRRGGELYGKASISDGLMLFAKFAALFPLLVLLLQLLGIDFPYYQLPEMFRFIGILILVTGSVFLYSSLADLGKFTKMGLPKNDSIQLQTTGIYRYSRNPMYLGVMLLTIASVTLLPNLLNIILGFTGIFLHHQIILKEEKFLRKTIGQQYTDYKAGTRRYL